MFMFVPCFSVSFLVSCLADEAISGPEVIKLFSCSTQLSTKCLLLIKKLKYQHK